MSGGARIFRGWRPAGGGGDGMCTGSNIPNFVSFHVNREEQASVANHAASTPQRQAKTHANEARQLFTPQEERQMRRGRN